MRVADRSCLVVGGGEIAARKAETLLDAGATVTFVSPRVTDEIESWVAAGKVRLERRGYRPGDLEGKYLVYAATDDDSLHERIAAEAEQARVLLNVVDRPQWCDFIVPSIARRGDLAVAVSTSGKSPAMARRVRLDIESMLTPEYEKAIEIFSKVRRRLEGLGWSYGQRKEVFERLLDEGILNSLRDGDDAAVDRLLSEHTGEATFASCIEPE